MLHKRVKITIAAFLVAAMLIIIAIFGGTIKDKITGEDGNPNTVKVNEETKKELIIAQNAAFSLTPKDSVLVSHISFLSLSGEAQQNWWGWFTKMLPPGFTEISDISGIPGLKSITLSTFPTKDANYKEASPFSYSVDFTISSENEQEAWNTLGEGSGSNGSSFMSSTPISENNDVVVISLTSITGLSDIPTSGNPAHFEPDPEWFPITEEPTMYVDAGSYFSTLTSYSEDKYKDTNTELMQMVFGISGDYKWIGASNDFGLTWTNTQSSGSADVTKINPAALEEKISDSIREAISSGDIVIHYDETTETEIASGQLDAVGLMPILDAVSIATLDHPIALGATLDVNDTEAPPTSAAIQGKVVTSVVISPQIFQSLYQGGISPSNIKTVTFSFYEDSSSTISFGFR